MTTISLIALGAFLLVAFVALLWRWGTNWGSTPAERAVAMPGDGFLEDGLSTRVVMTRAITIDGEPEIVWPWLAQAGRGAGWYSYDLLDNGGRTSAEHIVSWIPAPALGDASPIGYLRHVEPGCSLVWWVKRLRFAGASARLVVDNRLTPEAGSSRLVVRVSADAEGFTAPLALWVFRILDTIMARRQLLGMRDRVERFRDRSSNPDRAESGARDQYQLYEVIYASGERGGAKGKEQAERWRRTAIEDGVIEGTVT